MTFTANSGLVKIWVRKINNGTATIDNVPEIYNLKEVVAEVLASQE